MILLFGSPGTDRGKGTFTWAIPPALIDMFLLQIMVLSIPYGNSPFLCILHWEFAGFHQHEHGKLRRHGGKNLYTIPRYDEAGRPWVCKQPGLLSETNMNLVHISTLSTHMTLDKQGNSDSFPLVMIMMASEGLFWSLRCWWHALTLWSVLNVW